MFLSTINSLKFLVSKHHVFVNKKAVQKLWCQCIMFSSRRKQFKSCGVNASCICQQKSCWKGVNALCVCQEEKFKSCDINASCLSSTEHLKVVVLLHHVCQQKSCLKGVNVSCFYRQESSLKMAVLLHHVFVNN